MRRWLGILFLLVSCAPADAPAASELLCARFQTSCPVMLEQNDYWSAVPDALAPSEAVVEAVSLNGYATTTRTVSSTIELDSEEQVRACTHVDPIVVQTFRVTRVVAGQFEHPTFRLVLWGGVGCGSDRVILGLKPPAPDSVALLVIEETSLPEGVEPSVTMLPSGEEHMVPTVRRRPEGTFHPCFPPAPLEPAPGC